MKNTIRALSALLALMLPTACHTAAPEAPADPEVITLVADLGNLRVPAGQPSEVIARLRVTAAVPDRGERPPIDLALVIDTSGSMRGQAMEDARAASLAILDLLQPDDRVSVVAFHSRTDVVMPSTTLRDADLEEVREAIRSMEAQGTTDLAGGLSAGLNQVVSTMRPDSIHRIVLLGDGVPNDPSPVEGLAQSAGAYGVAVTALGLGLDYDEVLMGRIAQLSGGNFHYAADSSAVASIFRDEVVRLTNTVARNAAVTLTPGPGVTITSVVGQPAPAGGRSLRIGLGDLAEGETRELIVRLMAPARRPGSAVELLDATLQFVDAVVEAGALERTAFLGADATDDEEALASGQNAEVIEAADRAQAAAITIEAIQVVRAGDYERARELVRSAEERMSKSGGASASAYGQALHDFADSLDVEAAPAEALEEDEGQVTSTGRRRDRQAPAPAPAMEDRLRRAHEGSMRVLGY